MDWNVASEILQDRAKGSVSPCEAWTPEQKGRALEMIRVLANTPPQDWRTKKEIHAALAEFR